MDAGFLMTEVSRKACESNKIKERFFLEGACGFDSLIWSGMFQLIHLGYTYQYILCPSYKKSWYYGLATLLIIGNLVGKEQGWI